MFNVRTHHALASLLNKSSFNVLVSYSDVDAWRRFGLKNIQARCHIPGLRGALRPGAAPCMLARRERAVALTLLCACTAGCGQDQNVHHGGAELHSLCHGAHACRQAIEDVET